MANIITCISHGVYGVEPEACPLCPECDQPMWVGEPLELQTVDAGPRHPDLVRLVHHSCVNDDEEWDDEEEADD